MCTGGAGELGEGPLSRIGNAVCVEVPALKVEQINRISYMIGKTMSSIRTKFLIASVISKVTPAAEKSTRRTENNNVIQKGKNCNFFC